MVHIITMNLWNQLKRAVSEALSRSRVVALVGPRAPVARGAFGCQMSKEWIAI